MQWQGKQTSIIIDKLLGNGAFVGSASRLFNEDVREVREELRGSLEMAVEGD
jgi:hypothetical protein